jgi:hypothetical protein
MAVIGHCSSGRKLNAITSHFALADSGLLELGREVMQGEDRKDGDIG